MVQAQPGYENFPAAGLEDLEAYLHSTTGDEYVYYKDKHSWRVLSSAKNKIFTGPNSPDTPLLSGNIAGYVPVPGDLWWDTEHMELRVWHQPDPEDPSDVVPTPGRWISSTNPHMSPLSPKKNLVIGKLTIVDGASQELTNGVIYEDFDYDFEVERTDSNAPESSVRYEWSCTPETVNGQPIVFSNPTSTKTRVRVPKLKRDGSGNPVLQSMRIFCRVHATKDVESFLEPSKSTDTGILAIRPVPDSSIPLTGNVEVVYKSELEIFGTGTPDANLRLYEFDHTGLSDDNYDNSTDDYPPGALTYYTTTADTSYTNETSTVEFVFKKEDDYNQFPLQFFENPERTIPWGSTADTGADFGQNPDNITHTILVDKNFAGQIYFSKNPKGSDIGMAGHINWGFVPDPLGEIGTVTISGDPTPQKNVPGPYTVTWSGDLPTDTSDLKITYVTTDPDATIDQNTGLINFVTLGVHEIQATVSSLFASDRRSIGTMNVTVGDGLDSIGDVTIQGSETTTVGTPEVYNTFITGDVENYTIAYTTTDDTASITGNSIIFGSVGTFEVSSVVSADNVVESPVIDTITVDVSSGIASTITTHRDPAFTARPQTFNITPDSPIPNATYSWKTTRSSGGTVWEAKPPEAISGGTSGRETGEELVNGDVDGESFVRLNSTGLGPQGGLFITYPAPVTPTKVGILASCVDIDGNPTSGENVNVTIQTIPADGSAGSSYTTTISTGTPYEVVNNLTYVTQEIIGLRVQTSTSGHKLAIHGYTIDGQLIQSYLNDDIINNGENADITMYRFDETRTIQCIIDGVAGRSVGRLSLEVIDPPDPTVGSTRFVSPVKQLGANKKYIYNFTNTANIPVSYEAVFTVSSGNLLGSTPEQLENLYEIDYSDILNNNIGVTINFMHEDAEMTGVHNLDITGELLLIVRDARPDEDLDEGESRLDPSTAKVSNVEVVTCTKFMTAADVSSGEDGPANVDYREGYSIIKANPDSILGVFDHDSITHGTMVATNEAGDEFTGTSYAKDTDSYSDTFNLPAGKYTFRNTVTYSVEKDGVIEEFTANYYKTRTIS
jgi:hypothetical protein